MSKDGFRAIQIKEEVFNDLDKIKERWKKRQSLRGDFSWTNFLSQVVTELEKGEKERV